VLLADNPQLFIPLWDQVHAPFLRQLACGDWLTPDPLTQSGMASAVKGHPNFRALDEALAGTKLKLSFSLCSILPPSRGEVIPRALLIKQDTHLFLTQSLPSRELAYDMDRKRAPLGVRNMN